MLTIGQLAAYGGVTVRAVRHYHAKGLLPEPERDYSGYRRYGAAAVVDLIKIRTLADAGVPLARIKELLVAGPDEFATAIREIDSRLRREIRERQEHRKRIAQLAAGDRLFLPSEVTDYLQRLRSNGVSQEYVDLERDAWVLIAAMDPEQIPTMMAEKTAQLSDPRMMRLYVLLGDIDRMWDSGADAELDATLDEAVELFDVLLSEAEQTGQLERQPPSDAEYVHLLDAFADEAHPAVQRFRDLLAARGWDGWVHARRRESDGRADDDREGKPSTGG